MTDSKPIRLIDRHELRRRIPLHYVSIWKRMKAGTFPAPYTDRGGKNLWNEAEIDAWLAALPRRSCYPGSGTAGGERVQSKRHHVEIEK